MQGYIANAFEFNTESTFSSASISFTVSDMPDTAAIYYIDEENHDLVKLNCSRQGNTISTQVTHFSKYILLDSEDYENSFPEISLTTETREKPMDVVVAASKALLDPENLRREIYIDIAEQLDADEDDRLALVIGDGTFGNEYYKDEYRTLLDSMSTVSDYPEISDFDPILDDYIEEQSSTLNMLKAGIDLFPSTDENGYRGNSKKVLVIMESGLGDECVSGESVSDLLSLAEEKGIDEIIGIGFSDLAGYMDEATLETISNKSYISTAFTGIDIPVEETAVDFNGKINYGGTGVYNLEIAQMLKDGKIKDIYGEKVFGDNATVSQCASDYDYDGDGLKNYQEINIISSGNTFKVWYNSNPTEEDTDGDVMNDFNDPSPLIYSNVIEVIQSYETLESISRNLYKQNYGYDLSIRDLNVYTINMIRTNVYNGAFWDLVSGSLFYDLKSDIINNEQSEIFELFNGDFKLVDHCGESIDFVHMFATMSSYYYDTPMFDDNIIDDLAGWGADLQSFIYNLKIGTNGSNNLELLKRYAYSCIFESNTYFSMEDFNSDVDAFNIHKLYGENVLISEALISYYLSPEYSDRYSTFVSLQGGIQSIEERATEYTYGNGVVKNLKLNQYAKDAYKKNNLISKSVSKNESDALVYSFITRLEEMM